MNQQQTVNTERQHVNIAQLHALSDRVISQALQSGCDIAHLKHYWHLKLNRECSIGTTSAYQVPAVTKRSAVVVCIVGAILGLFVVNFSDVYTHLKYTFITSRCLIRNNYFVREFTRPKTNCTQVCKNVTSVKEFPQSVSKKEFEPWSYLGQPLVVRGGASDWPAIRQFSVQFIKNVYDNVEGSYSAVENDCQFLPFRSEFLDLESALSMHPARALYRYGTDPWYFGWSNCSPEVSTILRTLAPRPHFLPNDCEHSALDWVFMGGGRGNGASWHLDYVQRPSWQAQIKGHKMWFFRPVPECWGDCTSFNVSMNPGDIIFVDTNQWYHLTELLHDEISITIGSEYD